MVTLWQYSKSSLNMFWSMSSCVLLAMGLQHEKTRRSSSISRSARGALLAGFGLFSTIFYAICLTVSVM